MNRAAYNQIIYDLGCLLHNINHVALVKAQHMHLAKSNPTAFKKLQASGAATYINDEELQTSADAAVQRLYALATQAEQKLKILDNYWRTTPEYLASGDGFV